MTERRRRRSGFVLTFVFPAPREFAELPRRVRRRIATRLRSLVEAPRAVADTVFMWGDWEGSGRLVVGEYRVIYEIDDRAQEIRIVRIRHRSQAYERP